LILTDCWRVKNFGIDFNPSFLELVGLDHHLIESILVYENDSVPPLRLNADHFICRAAFEIDQFVKSVENIFGIINVNIAVLSCR